MAEACGRRVWSAPLKGPSEFGCSYAASVTVSEARTSQDTGDCRGDERYRDYFSGVSKEPCSTPHPDRTQGEGRADADMRLSRLLRGTRECDEMSGGFGKMLDAEESDYCR